MVCTRNRKAIILGWLVAAFLGLMIPTASLLLPSVGAASYVVDKMESVESGKERTSHPMDSSEGDGLAGRPQPVPSTNLPLGFELNQGQTDPAVKFLSRGSSYNLFLTSSEAVIVLNGRRAKDYSIATRPGKHKTRSSRQEASVVRARLVRANAKPRIVGIDALPGKTNYYTGKAQDSWKTEIPSYAKVKYEAVYPGIDLVYYGNQRQLETDFLVAPEADPGVIRVKYDGARKLRLEANGDLTLVVNGAEVRQSKPVAYQEKDGVRHIVTCRYVVVNKNEFGFELGKYDRTRALVIDPVLRFSTFYGGSALDYGYGIAVDPAGNMYVSGITASADFPTHAAFQPTINNSDAFVVKLDPTGSTVLYSTYLGGNNGEEGRDIVADASGNAYIGGSTSSTNFPLLNAAQPAFGGAFGDGFITKLNTSGGLSYSTYIGGNGWDGVSAIALDGSGSVYVTGDTQSANFPSVNSLPANLRGAYNVFVAKLNSAGSFVYRGVFGSSLDYNTEPNDIAVDTSGNAFVTGHTSVTDFPMVNPFQATFGGGTTDVFVTKVNPTGTALVYSTYLGGASWDYGKGIAVDSSGNAYVTGYTNSANFPTLNPFQAARSGNTNDVFVTKFNASGSALGFSTYLGGLGSDVGNGIVLDSAGNVCVVGSTSSTNIPTVNPLQPAYGGGINDVLLFKLNPVGSALIYCTYFGGTGTGFTGGDDIGYNIAVDSANGIYITGRTNSTNFPTLSPLQGPGGFDDAFIVKIGETYTISGRVADPVGGAISGVTVSISGDQTGTTETDNNGNYSFANVAGGGNFTVTPSSTLYHFSPASRTFNNLASNQTGDFVTINVYTVSGRITTAGGIGVAAVSVVLSGGQTGATQTDTAGYYFFTELPEAANYTLTPSSLSYNFAPASQTLTNLSGPQTANFSANRAFVVGGQVVDANGAGVGAVTMTLTGSLTGMTQTNSGGVYFFGNLAPGGNYTIAPSKPGYTFTPVNWSFVNLTDDANASFVVASIVNPPQISSLNPTAGQVGTPVSITGSNFGSSQGTSTVTFNGTVGSPSAWSNTSITVLVPSGASTGPVVATVGGVASNGVSFTVNAPSQTTIYYLHKEASITTATNQLKTSGPDSTVLAIQSVDLKSKALGEYVVSSFDTQADVPNASRVLPTGSTIVFSLWMRKTANFGTMFPRAKLFVNSTAGTLVCTVTGATALNTSITQYTLTGTTSAPFTLTTTNRLYVWVGVNLTAGNSGNTFKGELNIEGTLNGNYDSNVTVPLPVQPGITGISPVSGPVGATVTLAGSNFGPVQGASTLKFNGVAATPSSWSDSTITAVVPAGATTGPVVVSVDGMSSNGVVLTVGSAVQTTLYHIHKEASATSSISQLRTAGPDAASFAVRSVDLKSKPAGEYIINSYDTQYNVPNGVIPSGSTMTFVLWMKKTANIGTMFPRAKLFLNNTSGLLFCTATGATALNTTITKYTLTATTSAPIALTTRDRLYLWVGVNLTGTNGSNTFKAELDTEGTLNGNYNSNIVIPIPFPQPAIDSADPNVGPIGSSITISGSAFGATQGASTIEFNGLTASAGSWSSTIIAATVPNGATTGPVVVTVNGVASNGIAFTVGSSAGDLDGDGLPDSWEMQYFGNVNQTANGDFDGDGLSNFLEYLVGRNPTKSAIADTNALVNLKLFTPLEP